VQQEVQADVLSKAGFGLASRRDYAQQLTRLCSRLSPQDADRMDDDGVVAQAKILGRVRLAQANNPRQRGIGQLEGVV
jgi:hypothetical protein